MKTFLQAAGLITTALLLMTSCEPPKENDDSPVVVEKIIYLGKIIDEPKHAALSTAFTITEHSSHNSINSVHLDFENELIQYSGRTTKDAKCNFERKISTCDLSAISKIIRDLEFCG